MNNVLRKFMATLLCLFLLISSTMFAQAHIDSTDIYNDLVSEHGQEFVDNYIESMDMLSQLYDLLPRNEVGETIYPYFFGGRYINSDGSLVIQIVGSEISRMDANPIVIEGAIIQIVDFSFAYLIQLMNHMDQYILGQIDDSYVPLGDPNGIASSWSLDVSGNRVIVELRNYSLDEIALFQSTILDSPAIIFEPCSGRDGFFDPEFLEQLRQDLYEFNQRFPDGPIIPDDHSPLSH